MLQSRPADAYVVLQCIMLKWAYVDLSVACHTQKCMPMCLPTGIHAGTPAHVT